MKIKSFTKKAIALALLSGAALSVNANTYNLGAVSVGVPLSFNAGVAGLGTSFIDTFTFTLPANGGSGYSLIDFPLNIPGLSLQTIFSSAALFSGTPGNATFLKQASNTSNVLSLTWGPSGSGPYFLTVAGVTNGNNGGAYSGSISVTAVPEPESYALFLAGLGIMGAIARRRSKANAV